MLSNLFIFLNILEFVYICMCLSMALCMNVIPVESRKQLDPLELKLQAAAEPPQLDAGN